MSKKKIKQCEEMIFRYKKYNSVGLCEYKYLPKKLKIYYDNYEENAPIDYEKVILLAKQYIEKKSKTKERAIPIDMWVARDEDHSLWLCVFKKPFKRNGIHYPIDCNNPLIKIDSALYPNVKWEDDEPLKIN